MKCILATSYISQAFSLKALQLLDYNAFIKVTKINRTDIPDNCNSCIGHRDAAYFISKVLEQNIPFQRQSINFQSGDIMYVVMLNSSHVPNKQNDDDKTPEELANYYTFLKVEIQGFEGILALQEHKFTRLANNYLSYVFTLKTLSLVDYNALIRVARCEKYEIPSDIITCIKNPNQAMFLTEDLGFEVQPGYSMI